MRKMLAVFITSLLVPVAASAGSLEPMPSTTGTVGELVTKWDGVRAEKRASVVSVDWETYAFVIPAAGSLAGNFGTYFRSDVTFANRRSQDQIISIGWIARGVNNGSAAVFSFKLPANTTDFEPDFVGRVLGRSGLGSIVVIAVDSAGNVDKLASIDAFSRIWTNQPGSSGTVSQDFPPVDVEDNLATSYAYGLRQDEQYRTNVGLVNLNNSTETYTIVVIGTRGSRTFTQVVQPYSMEQVALPAGTYGDLSLRISNGISFNWWTAYGTSVDNITGDGWVSHVH